jgi:signal peptidase I
MKDKLRTIIKKIGLGTVVFVVLANFFIQIYIIPTTSMVPTLMPGDYIFVNKSAYSLKIPFTSLEIVSLGKPVRGDVVVFSAPLPEKKVYVKRLIAAGGERVAIKNGNVYVDGREIIIPSIAGNYYYNQGEYAASGDGIVVPENHFFFLGDNSIASGDSRFWGFVNKSDVIGKAVVIWWPPARVNMIE